jgi:hypothetical protein
MNKKNNRNKMAKNFLINNHHQLEFSISLPQELIDQYDDIEILATEKLSCSPLKTTLSELGITDPIDEDGIDRVWDFETPVFYNYLKKILSSCNDNLIMSYEERGGANFVMGNGLLNININQNKNLIHSFQSEIPEVMSGDAEWIIEDEWESASEENVENGTVKLSQNQLTELIWVLDNLDMEEKYPLQLDWKGGLLEYTYDELKLDINNANNTGKTKYLEALTVVIEHFKELEKNNNQ